jgi:hypothetical protein
MAKGVEIALWKCRAAKSSRLGWFYGFKLHLICNDKGELLSFCLTPGNVDDSKRTNGAFTSIFSILFSFPNDIGWPDGQPELRLPCYCFYFATHMITFSTHWHLNL